MQKATISKEVATTAL